MDTITIHTEFIKLGQLLKLASFVSQGSDAKLLIENGEVSVNGEKVYQRGQKIYPGDTVTLSGEGSVKVVEEGTL